MQIEVPEDRPLLVRTHIGKINILEINSRALQCNSLIRLIHNIAGVKCLERILNNAPPHNKVFPGIEYRQYDVRDYEGDNQQRYESTCIHLLGLDLHIAIVRHNNNKCHHQGNNHIFGTQRAIQCILRELRVFFLPLIEATKLMTDFIKTQDGYHVPQHVIHIRKEL